MSAVSLTNSQSTIQELRNTINDAVNKTMNNILGAAHSAIAVAADELETALLELKAIVEQAVSEIQEIEKDAEKLGESVQECVRERRENIRALAQKSEDGLRACTKGSYAALEDVLIRYGAILQKSDERIEKLVNEVRECADYVRRIEVVTQYLNDAAELNNQIRALVAEAVEYIQTTTPQVAQCIKGVVEQTREGVKTIVADVKECINNKTDN